MEPFTTLTAKAAPLPRANVDTEVIIPIARLIGKKRGELGGSCFLPWRYHVDGSVDESFSLNQSAYQGAQILVTGENFGCGSSREAAVWALWDMGFRVILAESFGDIFRANCFQNGLLPITLSRRHLEWIFAELAAANTPQMTVDLRISRITLPAGRRLDFQIDAERRIALLEGLDEIELTLRSRAEIEAYEAREAKTRPWNCGIAPENP
jgi:3-isopropylmalate/(R)-2-methylmalate dehydratase small subunit